MKVTALSFEFDGRDEQEVINVTKMLKELLSGASEDVSVETHIVAPKKEEKPVEASKTTSTAVPAFSEPTQTTAPVPEAKEVAVAIAEETIADAIAEVKKEMKKPEKVANPKTVKEAPQPTIDLEPVQAPIEEEKATEKASNEPAKADTETKDEAPTLKEMQHLVISSVKTGHVTRDEMASILLEFGGTSLSKVSASKFALLKQRIENYPLTR